MFRRLLPIVAFALVACTTDEEGGATNASLEPKGLTLAAYDTLEGLVTLSWQRVDHPKVLGYAVFRDPVGALDLSEEPVNRRRVSDTTYVDTLPLPSDAVDTLEYEYRVKILDKEGEYGPTGDFLTIRVPSPKLVTTEIDLDVLGKMVVSIHDTVRVVAGYSNPTRRIRRIEWIDGLGNSLRSLDADARSGRDTLVHVLDQAGPADVTVRLTDDGDRAWEGMVFLEALPDAPWADAGRDSSVFFRDSLDLVGRGLDGFGRIVKWEWDPGRKGIFTEAPEGVLRIAPPPVGSFACVLRVTDDDGQTGTDEVVFTVTSSRIIAPMAYPRFKPEAAVLNGKIYVMGGNTYVNALKVEEYDPDRRTWKHVATLPQNREKFQMVAAAGELYVLAGNAGGYVESRLVHGWNPATEAWTPRAEITSERLAVSRFLAEDDKIIAIHLYGEGGSPVNYMLASRYHPQEDRWDPTVLRGNHLYVRSEMMAYWGGRIYRPKPTNENLIVLDRHTFLTVGSQTLSTLHGRRNGVLFPSKDRIYLVAAWEQPNYYSDPAAVHWFDPVADAWSAGSPLNKGRINPAVCELDGALYIIGGKDPQTGAELATVEEYHPQ